MRNQPHPWNLRRIFGRQFVVCVGSPSRPEARIAARVIPAQSSRRIFRGPSDADLPTCRLADLPTWSWMTNGIPVRVLFPGHS